MNDLINILSNMLEKLLKALEREIRVRNEKD